MKQTPGMDRFDLEAASEGRALRDIAEGRSIGLIGTMRKHAKLSNGPQQRARRKKLMKCG